MSFDAATLLARMPPWPLEITLRRRMYERLNEMKRIGTFNKDSHAAVKNEKIILLTRQWDILLNKPGIWGLRTVTVIHPFSKKWLTRNFGEINYRSAQMLTAHGSFGHFVCRIGKRDSSVYFHCVSEDDTMEHTLIEWRGMNGVKI